MSDFKLTKEYLETMQENARKDREARAQHVAPEPSAVADRLKDIVLCDCGNKANKKDGKCFWCGKEVMP